MTPLERIHEALDDLEHAPLDTVRTIEDAAVLYVDVEEARRRLNDVLREVTAFLADTVPGKAYTIEGHPQVVGIEIKTDVKRTGWQHDDLMRHVVSRAKDERVIDFTTGEALESEADAVVRILNECVRPNWKVTGLKALGLEPDEFCKVEYGAKSVKVVRP